MCAGHFKILIYLLASSLMFSVEEVSEWAQHAQDLPSENVDNFLKLGITGTDFPSLVENGGKKLEELGLSRRGYTNELLYNMKLLLSGVYEKPRSVKNAILTRISFSRIRIDWEVDGQEMLNFPIRKYVVERWSRKVSDTRVTWKSIYEGLDTSCEDRIPSTFALEVKYRITAWNTLGRSDRVELNLRGAATTKGSYYQLMDSVVHGIVMASLVSDYFIANPYDIFIIALIAIVILLFRLKKGKTSKIGNLENICCYEFVYHVCNSMFTKHVIGIFISMSI